MNKAEESKAKKRRLDDLGCADKQRLLRYIDMQLRGSPANIAYIKVIVFYLDYLITPKYSNSMQTHSSELEKKADSRDAIVIWKILIS